MKFVIATAFISIFLFSCKKNAEQDFIEPTVIVGTNFDGRVSYFWNKIEPYPKSENDSITFYHIADASSPYVNGELTSATGMEIVGHYCYVTYHIAGSAYGGALEVFDIATPANPELVSQLLFTDTDLNECTVVGDKLYAVGGRDIYSSDFTENNTKGGILLEVSLANDLLTTNFRWAALPSYSGNSVNVVGDLLFVTSGSTEGGVFTLNKSDLSLIQSDYFDNAKFCDVRDNQPGNQMIVLQGYPTAKLHEYTATSSNVSGKIEHDILNQTVPSNGKAVVHIDNNEVYVCTGANGLMGFHASSIGAGAFLNFNSPLSGNANGVDTDPNFIYIANGLEGLIIVNKDDQLIHSIFAYEGSANYVQSNGDYVFIANGKGGLKILKRVNPLPVDNSCATRPTLSPENINGVFVVNKTHALSFRGENTIQRDFTNWGKFYYCGNLTLKRKMILNNESLTEIEGSLHVKDLFINPGSVLRVSGSVIVDGTLHLGGKLEFVGTGNTITVGGSVIRVNGYSVTGNYTSNVTL